LLVFTRTDKLSGISDRGNVTLQQEETVPQQKQTVPQQKQTVPQQKQTVPQQNQTVPQQKQAAFQQPIATTVEQRKALEEREQRIKSQAAENYKRAAALDERTATLSKKGIAVHQKAEAVEAREHNVSLRERAVNVKESDMNQKEQTTQEREHNITILEAQLHESNARNIEQERHLREREQRLFDRESRTNPTYDTVVGSSKIEKFVLDTQTLMQPLHTYQKDRIQKQVNVLQRQLHVFQLQSAALRAQKEGMDDLQSEIIVLANAMLSERVLSPQRSPKKQNVLKRMIVRATKRGSERLERLAQRLDAPLGGAPENALLDSDESQDAPSFGDLSLKLPPIEKSLPMVPDIVIAETIIEPPRTPVPKTPVQAVKELILPQLGTLPSPNPGSKRAYSKMSPLKFWKPHAGPPSKIRPYQKEPYIPPPPYDRMSAASGASFEYIYSQGTPDPVRWSGSAPSKKWVSRPSSMQTPTSGSMPRIPLKVNPTIMTRPSWLPEGAYWRPPSWPIGLPAQKAAPKPQGNISGAEEVLPGDRSSSKSGDYDVFTSNP